MSAALKADAIRPSSSGKHAEVALLVETLCRDLDERHLDDDKKSRLLEQLKIHGRTIEGADAIFTRQGIGMLARYGLDRTSTIISRAAMRCLANALLLVPPTRQILVDLDFPLAATPLLKSQDRDDEFLISRILFLTTYEKSLDVAQLVDKGQLAMLISTNLARHAQQHSGLPEQGHASPQDDLALSETLKLLFNLIHFCPTRTRAFSPAVPHVLQLLSTRSLARPPLEGPVSDLITALINLDLEDPTSDPTGHEALFSSAHSACHIERLVFILEKGIEDYSEAELDKVATPLLTLIRRTYDLAPNAVKHRVQDLLLPSDEERSRPLGSSDTLPSRLLRLSTSSMVPTLREHISSLLFELSERDPSTFVRNIGYGYASGFLMAHDLPLPEGSLGGNVGRGDNERQQGSADPESINPITGQRLNAESVVNMPEMTDEEKEREAERLFVLFERLKKTGVMNVKNPVEEAISSGRFEELPSEGDGPTNDP